MRDMLARLFCLLMLWSGILGLFIGCTEHYGLPRRSWLAYPFRPSYTERVPTISAGEPDKSVIKKHWIYIRS
jgi:hypothetical protein